MNVFEHIMCQYLWYKGSRVHKLKRILNSNVFFFLLIAALFLYLRGPQVISLFKLEGKNVSALNPIRALDGSEISLSGEGNKALIFWATWCKPCDIELARINKMILNNELQAKSIIAISVDDNKEVVQAALNERNYKFLVAYDHDGQLSKKFNVTGTPTIVILDQGQTVVWATSGLSPLLSFKLKHYLNQE